MILPESLFVEQVWQDGLVQMNDVGCFLLGGDLQASLIAD